MADNVAITAGSGTTIAADEVTRNAVSEKQQIIKISLGVDGTYDGLVSSTLPMPVTPAATELHLGKIGGETTVVTPTVTASATPDYTSGDSIGGKITLTSAVRVSGGSAVLQGVIVYDKANQKPQGTILIFDADPSAATITDNSAFAFSTDITKLIASVPVITADYTTVDSIATADIKNLGTVVKAASGTSLYAAFVTTTAANLASSSDIGLRFKFLQD